MAEWIVVGRRRHICLFTTNRGGFCRVAFLGRSHIFRTGVSRDLNPIFDDKNSIHIILDSFEKITKPFSQQSLDVSVFAMGTQLLSVYAILFMRILMPSLRYPFFSYSV